MGKGRAWHWGLIMALLGLGIWASILSMVRIYQVDELQNLAMARIAALHLEGQFFTNALVWMMGPLTWITRNAGSAEAMLQGGRLVFLAVYVTNIALIALNAGVRLRSPLMAVALLGAATLAPLWDYGFEVRHDNLILLGLLSIWWLGRSSGWGAKAYAVMGILAVMLVFVAFKSFAYVGPMTIAFLVIPPPHHGKTRIRLLGAWLGGALCGGCLVWMAYAVTGLWPAFVAGMQGGVAATGSGSRFSWTFSLGRLPLQIPLVLGLSAAALGEWLNRVCKQGRAALSWSGDAPEVFLCLGSLFVLWVNPTPFPYNLVNLVPFAYIAGFRFALPWAVRAWEVGAPRAILLGLLAFGHFGPFFAATLRHNDWTNTRQRSLMRLAEAMTDPATDRVYDAVGMVLTRASIGYHWYLHSLNLEAFAQGKRPSVSQMISERPAAVVIPNYRTDWLPESERAFLAERYIPLADDFWVLGGCLPAGGGTYLVRHPGRYIILGIQGGKVAPIQGGTVAGQGIPGGPIHLAAGPVEVRSPSGVVPLVVWVGPHLGSLPQVGPGDHQRLFVNWY